MGKKGKGNEMRRDSPLELKGKKENPREVPLESDRQN